MSPPLLSPQSVNSDYDLDDSIPPPPGSYFHHSVPLQAQSIPSFYNSLNSLSPPSRSRLLHSDYDLYDSIPPPPGLSAQYFTFSYDSGDLVPPPSYSQALLSYHDLDYSDSSPPSYDQLITSSFSQVNSETTFNSSSFIGCNH